MIDLISKNYDLNQATKILKIMSFWSFV